MASFVLIHGSWHGGWCFDLLRARLEAVGHEVITPDLPGMGGSAEELSAVTLADWAAFAVEQCRAAGTPVVLAGHSRGGLVISEAAERDPTAMSALVYICAMLLPNGLSRAVWKKTATPTPAFDDIITHHPDGHSSMIDGTRGAAVFAQLSPPDLVADAMARLVAEPGTPRATALSLTDARYGTVPRHYIECLQDQAIPIADQRSMQAMLPCATVTQIDTDHSPFLSAPEALAKALIAIAEGLES
jgi:pimeloyl-ACP methyl ester carboxylesterase